LLQASPEYATELSDHRFDGQVTGYSAEARAKAKAGGSFNRKKYNDNVLAFGSPLIRYISELMRL
jgi:hypothetical protein